jgi:FKBP-type peptidyl-prolyl cis-trans isomerase
MKTNIMIWIALVLVLAVAIFFALRSAKNQTAAAAEALEKGKAFLEANAKKSGVTVLPSGLQYEIIKEAEGAKPSLQSTVTTHYHGTLIDGTVFDSSLDRGTPLSFPLNAVIKGWQEGIPLMSVGAKYRFFIPSDLAYGNSSMGKIAGGSTLIFEVELLSFK